MKAEELIRLVELQLGRRSVRMSDRLVEDLGAESVDIVHLAVLIEEKSGVFVPVETLPEVKTVSDLAEYIQARLTL